MFTLLPYCISKIIADNLIALTFSLSSPLLTSYMLLCLSKLLYPSEFTLEVSEEENPWHSAKLPDYSICHYIYASIQFLPTSVSNLMTPLLLDAKSKSIILPAYISFVTSYMVVLQFLQDEDEIIPEHIIECFQKMKDTEAGMLLSDVMKTINIDMKIYSSFMNLLFQDGTGLEVYVNNTIPKQCDIHCLFALQLIFDRIAYTSHADVQQMFINDINILMSGSDVNTQLITTVNGWDIYLLYLIYKFMKKGDKYNLRYLYKYGYMYMDESMKEMYDQYTEDKKEEKKFKSQHLPAEETSTKSSRVVHQRNGLQLSTENDYYHSAEGELSPRESLSGVTTPTGLYSSTNGMTLSNPSLLKKTEDIDNVINGSIDLISRLIYESILLNMQHGCIYMYRLIAAGHLFSGHYFLGYLLLFRVLYYIKTKITQEMALNDHYQLYTLLS